MASGPYPPQTIRDNCYRTKFLHAVISFVYRVASAHTCFLLIAALPNVIQLTDFFYNENATAFSSLKAVVFKFTISFFRTYDILRCQDNWAIFF